MFAILFLSFKAVGFLVLSHLVAAGLGYGFRGKIHTGIQDAGKAVGSAAQDVAKKL